RTFATISAISRHMQCSKQGERTGSFQVDVHFNFCCRLLHRQIGRLITFKNSPRIDSNEAMSVGNVDSVAHQTSGRRELAIQVDRRHRVLDRQRGKLFDMASEERIAANYQPASSQLSQLRENPIEVLFSACVQDM